MSQPTAIANSLANACKMFLKDLSALPEDAFEQQFGGKARTVADIVYEVNLVNDHVGLTLRGEELFEWPEGGWIIAPDSLRKKSEVIAAFKASSGRIIETANAYTEEDLKSVVETENGPTTKEERCRFMTLHLWYHAGQLNFIQTLLGDDVWHWMDA